MESAGGAVVKRDGELVMCAFSSAAGALGLLGASPFRAGVHVGDVSHESDDIYGMAVHVAKRLYEVAPPGRVLVSELTAELGGAATSDPRRLELRGVAATVSAVVLNSGAPPRRKGRLHAVVVTDLIGSTALRSAVGEARADELRRENFRRLGLLATGRHGTVVRTTGDGLVVEFDSVVEAAAAALAFQHSVGGGRGSAVAIRVGVEAGEDAARIEREAVALCDAGRAGAVLAGPIAAALLQPHQEFEMRASESGVEIETAGFNPGIALPPALTAAQRGDFVGRETELRVLREAVARARDGGGLLTLVAGEAGIGKSRLVREVALRAHDEGATVLLGRCDEQPLMPYQPFVEALSHYVSAESIDDLALRAGGLPDLAVLVPRLGERLPGLTPGMTGHAEEDRYRLFEAVTALLVRMAHESTTLVLFEDLHWADTSTLQLLRHVARQAAGSGLAVVGTYRTSEVSRRHPLSVLTAELREVGAVERLEVHGLPAAALEELIREQLGRADSGSMAQMLLERTDGNPFFVHEMLKHFSESMTDMATVPEGVRDVVVRRLGRLSASTRRLLSTGGVAGREFDRVVVERAAGLTTLDGLDAIDEALAAEFVVEVPGSPGRYRFTHALMRDAVEEELGHDRRAVVHLRLAFALEESSAGAPDHLAELSRHFFEAGAPGDPAKAVRYAMLAAERAVMLLAYEEAGFQFERALTALDWSDPLERELRTDLLLSLADARIKAGNRKGAREAATHAASLAREMSDGLRLARAALWAEGGWVPVGSSDPVTVELLEEALQVMGEEPSPLRARLLAALAMQTYYTADGAAIDGASREALDIARRLGDPDALGRALHARHYTLRGLPAHLPDRLEMSSELLELAIRRGDREQEGLARMWMAVDRVEAGDLPGFDEELEALDAAARELKRPLYAYWVARLRVMRALMVGDFPRVGPLIDEAFRLGQRAGESNAVPQSLVQRATLARAVGGEADVLETMKTLAFPIVTAWAALRACVLIDVGRAEDAAELLTDLTPTRIAGLKEDAFTGMLLAHVAEVVAVLGLSEHADAVIGRLEPAGAANALTPTGTTYVGPLPYFVGLLHATVGRCAEALTCFDTALAMAERLQALPTIGRIALARSDVLRSIGDGDAARAEAEKALEIALATASPRAEQRARSAVAASRANPRS